MTDSIRRLCGYSRPRLGPLAFKTYFRFAPDVAVKELFPGIRVRLNFKDDACRETWWRGYRYEHPLPLLLQRLCATGVDTFFDIGANYGFFSYLVLSQCPDVNVFSFEPNPHNFAIQSDAKTRNALAHFHPQNLGLSNESGELDLTVELNHSGHSVFGPEHPDFNRDKSKFGTYRIPVVRFDDWLKKQTGMRVSNAIVKMDIEGFEVRALGGMSQALSNNLFKALIVEVYAPTLRLCATSPAELGDFLAGFGYFPFDLFLRPTSIRSDDARNLVFLRK